MLHVECQPYRRAKCLKGIRLPRQHVLKAVHPWIVLSVYGRSQHHSVRRLHCLQLHLIRNNAPKLLHIDIEVIVLSNVRVHRKVLVAHAAGQDPLSFRRKLLEKQPRMKAVLELAAEKAGWGTPLPPGRGRGIAVAEAFKTVVAQVAEVSVDKDGAVRVDRVVCAVDCGTPINPDIIAAQMEGGIGFGLGAVLYGAITLKDGRVEQDNFNGYRVLRINEMPKVEVHIVPSAEPPTGVGEPGVAPVGPAVANAIFAATGKRHYVLPLSKA